MRFGDSDTQKMLRETARSYLAERFPWERLYAIQQGTSQLAQEDLQGFAELGWLGLLVPEASGGGGAAALEAGVVVEEFGYAAVPAPVLAGNVAGALLSSAAPSDTIAGHLKSLATGQRTYTICEATRRRGREAAGGLSAVNGEISGQLPLVPFAGLSDFVLAPLLIDGEPVFAAIPLERAELEPVHLLDRPAYANVSFREVALEGLTVLALGKGAEELHERCDALVTALSLIELGGMMQRILEMTSEFVTNRVQFGQPIGKFQAVRHRAAELLMQTETTRWTAYHALWRFQEDPEDTDEIWMAKHWAIRAAERVYQTAHLLHGGVGVGAEYPLHLYTQGVAAFAVRGGTMREMVERTIESLKQRQSAEGSG